jgi:hypothetical protein
MHCYPLVLSPFLATSSMLITALTSTGGIVNLFQPEHDMFRSPLFGDRLAQSFWHFAETERNARA